MTDPTSAACTPEPSAVQPASRWKTLFVREVVEETHDAKSLVLDVPADLAQAFQYRPGQFLTLRLPVGQRRLQRCYSMSSAPGLDAGLRVTIKRVRAGLGSNWLCDRIRAGSQLEVLPPAGIFTPRRWEGDFVLLAGGSGITPVYSILRTALVQGTGRIVLIYANRDERSVIFHRELRALAAEHPERLMIIHWLDSVQGVPSVAQLAALVAPLREAQAYLCGPAPFMQAGEAALIQVGMDEERIHIERFMSLPDDDGDQDVQNAQRDERGSGKGGQDQGAQPAGSATSSDTAASGAEAPAAPITQAQIEISHQGQIHQLSCAGDESLLDAALRQGLELPYSCREGLCAACTCQVQHGEVHLRANHVLDHKDLSRGWTLACQAVPRSPTVRVRFAE